jgi:hypothetical protein
MATFNDPYGIGTSIGAYYGGALANDPRLPAINRNISGQIAPDVRNMLGQAAAERGIGIGSYGGGNDQSSLLRALGLTSMDLSNKGIDQYGSAYNSVPALNPTSLFINPTDQAQMDLQKLMQTESLNSGAAIQAANRASQERMHANSLGASGSQFNRSMGASQARFDKERADALSGFGKTDSMLQGIIDRNSGGGSRGGTTATGNWGSQVRMNAPLPDAYYGGVSGYYDGGTSDPYWDNPNTSGYGQDYYDGGTSDPYWDNPNTSGYGQDYYAGGFVDETYPAWEDQLVDW